MVKGKIDNSISSRVVSINPIKSSPPGAPPKQPSNGLTVTVSLKDTEPFNMLLDIIKFLINNVSNEVRDEALKKINEIGLLNNTTR